LFVFVCFVRCHYFCILLAEKLNILNYNCKNDLNKFQKNAKIYDGLLEHILNKGLNFFYFFTAIPTFIQLVKK